MPATHSVSVVVEAPAARVRAEIGRWSTVEELGDGSCRVSMAADSLAWPLMALGSVGAEFRVEDSPALVAELSEWSDRFGRAVRASPRARSPQPG
jgi:hypothetical protein